MKIIPLVLVLLFFLNGCSEPGLVESGSDELGLEDPSAMLFGTWKRPGSTLLIRFGRDYTYTLQFAPNNTFQLSYYLDSLNHLVLYDSATSRTYSVKFLGSEELQLTDLNLHDDVPQRVSVFHRAE